MDCLATADSIQISKEPLQYLDDGDFRYLGRPTNVRGCEKLARSEISSKLKEWLLLVDAQHLPKTCKLWLYQHFIVAKMSWYFTALDLTATFVKTLQSVSTKFLKNWSGLSRPANTSILFWGKSGQAGLHITNLVTFWKQMQIVRMDLLKNSADPRCRKLYDAHVQRQSTCRAGKIFSLPLATMEPLPKNQSPNWNQDSEPGRQSRTPKLRTAKRYKKTRELPVHLVKNARHLKFMYSLVQ